MKSVKLQRLSQLAIAQKRDETADDILTAMPFLAPVLNLGIDCSARGRVSGRLPSLLSVRKALSVRARSKGALQSPRSESFHSHQQPPTAASPSSPKTQAKEYKLSADELELAVRAWFQHHGDNSLALDPESGQSKSSNSALMTPQHYLTAALTSTKHSLASGKELLDLLKGLHVPVTSTVEPYLEDVLYTINETPGSGASGIASGVATGNYSGGATSRQSMSPVPRTGKPIMYFIHFLRFLQCCKHLTALQRHREATGRLAVLPQSSRWNHGAPSGTDDDDPFVAEQVLDQAEYHDAFMYISRECSGRETATVVTDVSTFAPVSVSARALSNFASSFVLSPEAVLPQHFVDDSRAMNTPPSGPTTDRRPSMSSSINMPRTTAAAAMTPKSGKGKVAETSFASSNQAVINPALLDQRVTLEEFRLTFLQPQQHSSCQNPSSNVTTARKDDAQAEGPIVNSLLQKSDVGGEVPSSSAKKIRRGGDGHAAMIHSLEEQFSRALKPFATRAERHSPFSTAQQPPSTYLQFVVSHRQEQQRQQQQALADREAEAQHYRVDPKNRAGKKVLSDEQLQEQLDQAKLRVLQRGHLSAAASPCRSEPIASTLAVSAAKNLLHMLQQAPPSSILASPDRMLDTHRRFSKGF